MREKTDTGYEFRQKLPPSKGKKSEYQKQIQVEQSYSCKILWSPRLRLWPSAFASCCPAQGDSHWNLENRSHFSEALHYSNPGHTMRHRRAMYLCDQGKAMLSHILNVSPNSSTPFWMCTLSAIAGDFVKLSSTLQRNQRMPEIPHAALPLLSCCTHML